MLTIRKEQFAALQAASDLRWFAERLRKMYPGFAIASPHLQEQWVREGVERGRRFGLERGDLLQFLAFEQTFHPDCIVEDDFEWARRILLDEGESPSVRMKYLRHRAIDRLLALESGEVISAEPAYHSAAAWIENNG